MAVRSPKKIKSPEDLALENLFGKRAQSNLAAIARRSPELGSCTRVFLVKVAEVLSDPPSDAAFQVYWLVRFLAVALAQSIKPGFQPTLREQ